MSCDIQWDSVEKSSFLSWSKELLYDALNSGKRPLILSDEILVKDLSFGSTSPSFEILEIGDLGKDKFRGIFKLKYDGDAHITLSTAIQANLLKIYQDSITQDGGDFALPKFGLSSKSFSMPLFVDLRDIRLSGIIVVVFSKSKGLTLVFKNDPLENIKVSSSFDNVRVIERFLQKKIENQIRDLFRDILPSVLHKVSQKWTTSNVLHQLHSKLDPSHSEKISIFDVNPRETEVSHANMLKLSTLNTSRQSLRLCVPPFPDVVERPGLSKYEENYSSLANCRNIPIELITRVDGYQLDTTLTKLATYQSKNYHNEKNSQVLKRRSIKINKKKKEHASEAATRSVKSEDTLVDPHHTTRQKVESSQQVTKEKAEDCTKFVPPLSIPLRNGSPVRFGTVLRESHQQAPLSPMIEKLQLLHFNSHESLASRPHSPRKSQSNLLFGPGLNHHLWVDAPPPYN